MQPVDVGQKGGGPGAGSSDGIRGDRQDHRRQAGGPETGQIGLSEVAGVEGPRAVRPTQVVAEDAGPDEGLDVEVDDLARPVELEGGAAQPASAWLGGTSSTQVLPGVSFTSAPEASV